VIFRPLKGQYGIPVLFGGTEEALRLAERIYVISEGKIVFQGTCQELKDAHGLSG